jgi:hypothetical protein
MAVVTGQAYPVIVGGGGAGGTGSPETVGVDGLLIRNLPLLFLLVAVVVVEILHPN